MLLQQIVAQLDAELDRLRRLRSIVAALEISTLPSLLPSKAPEPVPAVVPPVIEPVVSAKEPHRHVRPRKRASSLMQIAKPSVPRRALAPGALNSAIPAGPVLVSAQAVARELDQRSKLRAPAAAVPQVSEVENLDRITRQLSDRWVAGLKQVRG